MEEEKIIINEENNYEAVIVEDTEEIIYDETIQIIELDEPEIFGVDTDEAFASLGGQNEHLNHKLLHNRDAADQHTIGSITGLREELDGIHALKTVESDKRGSADYYMWKDTLLPGDWIGHFVSMHTDKDSKSGLMVHKIRICNDKAEIFGVTVDSAGFVGGQEYNAENKPRGDEYALVANTGVVKVKCEPDVNMGDYVMSNKYGEAAKSNNNKYGYYVISIDNVTNIADPTNIQRYAVISLDSTMNQVYTLSEDVISFNERVRNVEINTNAAINAATEALQKSESRIDSALQNSQDALDNANSALDKVEDFKNGIEESINGINAKVDAVDDAITIAAHEASREVVNELINDAVATNQSVKDLQGQVSEAQEILEKSLEDIRVLSEDIQPLVRFENGEYDGVAGVAASVKDNTVQIATISQCLSNDYTSIDTWGNSYDKDKGQIYYVKDEKLYYYYDATEKEWLSTPKPTEAGLSEAIAGVHQMVDEDEAMVESLASYTGDKYISVPIWNKYVVIYGWEQYKHLADPYMIYFDSQTNSYWQCDLNNLEEPWSKADKPEGWDALTDGDVDKVYYGEDTERYYYYDHYWRSTVSSTAKMVASIALSKQYANSNEARINNIVSFSGEDGKALAEIQQMANNHESQITSLTSYVENNYEKFDEQWDKVSDDKKIQGNIYYAKDSDGVWKYWYYKTEDQEPGWVGSPNPSDAGLVASIVNVQQQASDNGASIAELQSWQGKTNDAIAKLESSTGDDGASMESLVMNISKYTVGKYSQAYGLTVAEAQDLLRDGTVFVPSEDTTEFYDKYIKLDDVWSENTDEKRQDLIYYAQKSEDDWKFWDWDEYTEQWVDTDKIDAVQKRNFSRESYYVWNKNDGLWYDGSGGVRFVTEYIIGGSATKYIVIEDGYTYYVIESASKNDVSPENDKMYYFTDESKYYYYYNEWIPAQNPNFEIGALYEWDDEKGLWHKVATLESNTLNRVISQMRQSVTDTESEFSVGLTNVKGDLSSVEATVDNMKAQYITQTSFDGNFTTIEQKSTVDTATLSMLASTGVIATTSWSETGKDTNKVYYDTVNKRYYYCTINNEVAEWNFAESITDPNVASKIKSAGIITAINNDESKVKISGDKISIKATDISLEGVVTFEDLKSDAEEDGSKKTIINGSNITTGIIKSSNTDGVIDEYSVIPGDTGYSFDCVGEYYESNNKGVGNSVAMCKIVFNVISTADIKFDACSYAEYKEDEQYAYDYGMFGYLDQDLGSDSEFNSNDVCVSFRYNNSSDDTTITYEDVEKGKHYIWVSFKKDTRTDKYNDCMRFKFADGMVRNNTTINLNDSSITTRNFKVDANGNVTINGYLSAYDVGYGGKTIIDGARITTGIISADRIGAGSITADKLDVGAITAEKINVGWQSGNCATNWTNTDDVKLETYFKIEQNSSSPYYDKISLIEAYTKGTTIRCSTKPFYASSGETFKYGGTLYNKAAKLTGLYFEYASESNSKSWSWKSCKQHSKTGISTVNASYTTTQPGWYRLTYALDNQSADCYCKDVYCYRSVKGNMIVNGRIESTDGNTYFDLDTGEVSLMCKNGKYIADFNSAYLKFKWDTYDTGYIEGYTNNGTYQQRRLMIYSPNMVEIGYGETAATAIGTGLLIDSSGVHIQGALDINNATDSKHITTKGTTYSGLTHTRMEDDKELGTIKAGVGKVNSIPSASLELSKTVNNKITVQARLDVVNSSSDANAEIYLQGTSGRSSPLALGDGKMWFNGDLIHNVSSEKYKTQISQYDANALNMVNSTIIYSYKYKHDGENAPTKYGVIIERECPKELVDNSGDAISIYSMCSILWKAVQELSDKVTKLEEKINERNY